MNKKILITLISVLLIASIACLGFITNHPLSNMQKEINIFYLNKNETTIASEKRTLFFNSESELQDLVWDAITNGPQSTKHKPVIPKNTTLLNKTLVNSSLSLNFSKDFLRDDTTKNMLSVYAIVRTFCQIDKISTVSVTVEGKPVKASDGNEIGPMGITDINLETDTYTSDSKSITLYFKDETSGKLCKEIRTINVTDTTPLETHIIKELIKGPVSPNLARTLTEDTELVSVETANRICHVTFKNFIEKNLSDSKSQNSLLAVYSVVNSLCTLDNIDSVRFLFEGKTTDKIGKFDFGNTFSENQELIKK